MARSRPKLADDIGPSNSQSPSDNKILTSLKSKYLLDENGVCVGVAMATAVALKHTTQQMIDNATGNFIACAQKFPQKLNQNNIANVYKQINSRLQKKTPKANCTLATSHIIKNKRGGYTAVLANSSDSMIFIINKDRDSILAYLPAQEDFCIESTTHELEGGELIIHLPKIVWEKFLPKERSLTKGLTIDEIKQYLKQNPSQESLISSRYIPEYPKSLLMAYLKWPENRPNIYRELKSYLGKIDDLFEETLPNAYQAAILSLKNIIEIEKKINSKESNFTSRIGDILLFIRRPNSSIEDINLLFNVMDQSLFNIHNKHPTWDRFFGIRHTKSWQKGFALIRLAAKDKLFEKVEAAHSKQEKLAILEWALHQPLFCQHRSNRILAGAWGKTATVNKIKAKMNEIKKMKSQAEELRDSYNHFQQHP